MCVPALLHLSAHCGGGRIGSKGCPGLCRVSGQSWHWYQVPRYTCLSEFPGGISPHEKDAGRGVVGGLSSVTLTSFPRAQGIVPPEQGRQRLPRGAWSSWKRTPSTPPCWKVSQGGAGQASGPPRPGLGCWETMAATPSACSGQVSSGGAEDRGSYPLSAEGVLCPAAEPRCHPAE